MKFVISVFGQKQPTLSILSAHFPHSDQCNECSVILQLQQWKHPYIKKMFDDFVVQNPLPTQNVELQEYKQDYRTSAKHYLQMSFVKSFLYQTATDNKKCLFSTNLFSSIYIKIFINTRTIFEILNEFTQLSFEGARLSNS